MTQFNYDVIRPDRGASLLDCNDQTKEPKDTVLADNFSRNIVRKPFCFKSPFFVSAERPSFGGNTFFRQERLLFGRKSLFWQKDLLLAESLSFGRIPGSQKAVFKQRSLLYLWPS